MRGVAAIAVVVRHFGQVFHRWEPDSYLAVDLFFVLSGFVLAYKYDPMFAKGFKPLSFMRSRAIRLFPFALVGALVGLASNVFASATHLDFGESLLSAILTAVGLPTPPMADPRILFPLNPAFWSLFFEFWVANVLFAAFWRWNQGLRLWGVVAASAIALFVFQRLYHYVDIGWTWTDIIAGFPRVIFSFFVGVAINRYYVSRDRHPVTPAWACLVGLVAILLFPAHGPIANFCRLFCILAVFPALVYVGACAKDSYRAVSTAVGDMSYGLYTIHFPLLVMAAWWVRALEPRFHLLNPMSTLIIEVILVSGACGLAFLLDAIMDRPARRALASWTKGRREISATQRPA
jgi:peptidoglycan/LPS O-acetylase OafA/YrhL